MIALDFNSHLSKLQVEDEDGKLYVHCLIRNKRLVLQPEEVVRQLMLHVMIEDLGYPASMIQVEKMLKINNLRKRYDIIVYRKDLTPYLLVECKNMEVKLTQDTYDQVSTYNIKAKSKYVCITNGIETRLCEINQLSSSYKELKEFPPYPKSESH